MESIGPLNEDAIRITELLISAITPVIGGIIAWRLATITKRIEKRQWANQKLIEKRIEVYDQIIGPLNDLYCFYTYVGNWKELTPPGVIGIKRFLDKKVHTYGSLFSADFVQDYERLMQTAFQMYGDFGTDARIRSSAKRRQILPGWQEGWSLNFAEEQAPDEATFKADYQRFIRSLTGLLGIEEKR